jgi:hypothetical protein
VENFASIFCIGLFVFYLLLLILLVSLPGSSSESSTHRPGTRKRRAWRLPFRTSAKH